MANVPPIYQRRRSRRITSLLVSVLILIIGLWSLGLYQFAQNSIPDIIENEDIHTDAIVVLTGGSRRLDVGLTLLAENAAERLFISGVYRGIDVNQLLTMFRDNPDGLASRVEIGNATDTSENAMETADWARANNIQSIRLVTAAYHMPRSMLEFSYWMPGVTLTPHPVFPDHVKEDWWLWPGTTWLVVKEYNKYLVVKLRQQAALLISGLNYD